MCKIYVLFCYLNITVIQVICILRIFHIWNPEVYILQLDIMVINLQLASMYVNRMYMCIYVCMYVSTKYIRTHICLHIEYIQIYTSYHSLLLQTKLKVKIITWISFTIVPLSSFLLAVSQLYHRTSRWRVNECFRLNECTK